MEFWQTLWQRILTSILIAIILPVIFGAFGFFKARGDKKLPQGGAIRTRPPKIVSGFFLGFALLMLFGGIAAIIYCSITDSEHTTIETVIIASVCIAVFSTLGFFGYAWVRFNYVVADDEGIVAYRFLRKTKYYRYEEIGYFHDTTSFGAIGGLIGYDRNNRKIFAVEEMHIGVSAVVQRLREHGVEERGQGQLRIKK